MPSLRVRLWSLVWCGLLLAVSLGSAAAAFHHVPGQDDDVTPNQYPITARTAFMEMSSSMKGTQACGNTKATCCNRLICPFVNGVCCGNGNCCPTGTVCLPRLHGQQQVCGIPAPCQCAPQCRDAVCPPQPPCCEAYRQQQADTGSCSCPSQCAASACPNRPGCCPPLPFANNPGMMMGQPGCNCPPPCMPPGPCPFRPSCCPSITAPPRNGCMYPSPCTQSVCPPIVGDCNRYGVGLNQYPTPPQQQFSNDMAAAALTP